MALALKTVSSELTPYRENISGVVSGIYCITNNATGMRYVGSSINMRDRKAGHFRALGDETHRNRHLQNAFNRYGGRCFSFLVLEECSEDSLVEREIFFMDLLKTLQRGIGYNLLTADRSNTSPETLRRMSAASTGRKHTEETKKKIGAGNRGKVRSPEAREKVRQARLGTKMGPMPLETRKKISKAHQGKTGHPHTEESKRKISLASRRPRRLHSEETKRKISQTLTGRTLSEKEKQHRKVLRAIYFAKKKALASMEARA